MEAKSELSSALNEAVIQLIQAQKYLNQNDLIRSAVYLGNVQELLPKLYFKLLTLNRNKSPLTPLC